MKKAKKTVNRTETEGGICAETVPDIVEELRADADAGIGWAASNLRRAADEIERLTADNHKLMLWNEQLQAELDIARRALEGK